MEKAPETHPQSHTSLQAEKDIRTIFSARNKTYTGQQLKFSPLFPDWRVVLVYSMTQMLQN